jgi:hypothetical protein
MPVVFRDTSRNWCSSFTLNTSLDSPRNLCCCSPSARLSQVALTDSLLDSHLDTGVERSIVFYNHRGITTLEVRP